MNKIHAYLHFPTGLDNLLSNVQEGADFIEQFQMTLDRADCEKDVQLYYSKTNKDSFFSELNLFQDETFLGNFGGYRFEEVVNILLNETDVKNWETEQLAEQNCNYKHWISENLEPTDTFPSVLPEMCERELRNRQNGSGKLILINFANAYFTTDPISMIKTCRNVQPLFIHLNFVSNFTQMDQWLSENIQVRNYNHNDFRHIETHPNYINGKSPLLDGLGGLQNMANLLGSALGDRRKMKYLVNFDYNKNQYVRYEDENTNSTYHGYHLVTPGNHDTDEDAVKEISERVKLLIKYRKSLE